MPARIFSSIVSDIEHLHALKALFEQQAECLRSRNMDTLSELNDQIAELTKLLQRHSSERSTGLVALGFEDSREGMQNFLAAHASSQSMEQWLEFSRLARECQQGNQLSGKLLAMQQELTGTMLERLGREQETGYGQDGSDSRYGQSVSLGYA